MEVLYFDVSKVLDVVLNDILINKVAKQNRENDIWKVTGRTRSLSLLEGNNFESGLTSMFSFNDQKVMKLA